MRRQEAGLALARCQDGAPRPGDRPGPVCRRRRAEPPHAVPEAGLAPRAMGGLPACPGRHGGLPACPGRHGGLPARPRRAAGRPERATAPCGLPEEREREDLAGEDEDDDSA